MSTKLAQALPLKEKEAAYLFWGLERSLWVARCGVRGEVGGKISWMVIKSTEFQLLT